MSPTPQWLHQDLSLVDISPANPLPVRIITDTQQPQHLTMPYSHRRHTINYPNTGPYRSRYCNTRSSEPVTPWSNPRRSPYCARQRADDKFAYEANTSAEKEEAERAAAEENHKEDYLEDAIPSRVRRQGMFGTFGCSHWCCLLRRLDG